MARVSVMTVYYPMQFIVSAVLFFALSWAFKADPRAGAGFILVVFTSLYYGSWLFVAFAALVYAGIIISLFYLGKERAKILKGI